MVMDVYDNGDNTWIGMDNIEEEWCIVYHEFGRYLGSNQVKDITGNRIKGEILKFKSGNAQVHQNMINFINGKK